MKSKYNLTEGPIVSKLLLVALPLMGTQMLQMVYNLTDMFWLGRLSSDAVAASGVVGFYLWLAVAFFMFGRMGAEIGVSQNIGKGDMDRAQDFARNALWIGAALGAMLAAVFFFARGPLIGVFGIREAHVAADARSYLAIVSFGQPFVFVSLAISGILAGAGNTRISLAVSLICFGLNMILDPILIFVAGMGIHGAAAATVTANVLGAVLSLIVLYRYKNRPFKPMRLFKRLEAAVIKQIFKWVAPVSAESFLFTALSISVTSLIAAHGSGALTANRVSTQIESMTWLVGGGFATAMTAFTGQNFGAGKWSRIHKGFRVSSLMMACWGTLVTLVLFFGGRVLIRLFIPDDPAIVEIGAEFMRLLAFVQIPACLEGVAAGIFRGQGKTFPPSISSIASNVLRVAAAYAVANLTGFGLTGLWVVIALSAGIRGVAIVTWYLIYSRKLPKEDV